MLTQIEIVNLFSILKILHHLRTIFIHVNFHFFILKNYIIRIFFSQVQERKISTKYYAHII